jgi:hypothetical protein
MPRGSGLFSSFRNPAVMVVVGILLVAAVGLNATAQYLKLTFRKEPVDLRRPVASLPARLGPWQQVSVDKPLPPDIEHTLGTKDYVFRVYVDTSIVPASEVEQILALPGEQREVAAMRIRPRYPKAVINVALTYYTGMVDTVAHIPERCFVAGGFDISGGENRTLPVRNANGETLTIRLLNFEDQQATSVRPVVVGYFFQVNGNYEHDAINGVRWRLQKLTEKYAYYSKIELMLEKRDRDDQTAEDAAVEAFTRFLTHAMPEMELILPDWQQVVRQTEAD